MKADPASGDAPNPFPPLVEQHAHLDPAGTEAFGVVAGVGEGQARIEDIVDEENIPATKVAPAGLESLQSAGGAGAAIAGDRPELHLGGGFQMAKEIDDKKDAALKQGNHGQGSIPVKLADGAAQFADATTDPRGGNIVLAGRPGHWPEAVGVRRFSSSEILAVRGPSIFRFRPFCQEARALSSSSSWAKQRPA